MKKYFLKQGFLLKKKKNLFLLIVLLLAASCQSEPNAKIREDRLINRNEQRMDSLEELADKMRDESPISEPSIIVKFDGGWLADKELNTIRRVTLENRTNKKVVGVKLAYGTGMSKEFDDRNVGKFKVAIKPHGKAALQIRAKRFGVSDDVIQNSSYTSLMFRDSIATSVIYYSDGTTGTN